MRLREKQRLRAVHLRETQLRRAFERARRRGGKTGDVNLPSLTAQLVRRPERREIPVVCDEQLVVEHYSR